MHALSAKAHHQDHHQWHILVLLSESGECFLSCRSLGLQVQLRPFNDARVDGMSTSLQRREKQQNSENDPSKNV